MKPTEYFQRWLEQTPGPWKVGQVMIGPGFCLWHAADGDLSGAVRLKAPDELIEWIKCDARGEYRPLRASPDLKKGWVLEGVNFDSLVLALNWIYPGCVAHWVQWANRSIPIVEYVEKSTRQTGMYHITRHLTPDQLGGLIDGVCRCHCLKKRLWSPPDSIEGGPDSIPLLCCEPCNYFIGKARDKIKEIKTSGQSSG